MDYVGTIDVTKNGVPYSNFSTAIIDRNNDGISDTKVTLNITSWSEYEVIKSGAVSCTAPTISSLTNSTPTTNSVTITWITNQSADNRVKYSKNSDLSNPLWSSWDNDTTSVSITLTSLEANTTYYYQAWSYNGTNSSCYTTEPSSQPYRSFTTQSSGGQYTITLEQGYNMIGWTSTTPTTSSELCSEVPYCEYVYLKNPDASWTSKRCGFPGGDFSISRGFGCLVKVSQSADWTRDE